jgi:hypothetical protein
VFIDTIASIELKLMPTVMEPTGPAAERFGARMGFISNRIGGKQLGYNITAMPKDKRACPAGGKETAHQIINTSEEELRFLAVSTKLSLEIAEYPDTNRFGVLASLAPDETGRPRTMMYVGKEGYSLYSWEGE